VRAKYWILIAIALGFESVDAAPQWQVLPGAPVAIRIDDLHFIDANNGWVGTGEGRIYHTSDGGVSWALQHDDPDLYFRCIRFADAQRGFAGTLTSSAILYHTVNGGGDWTPVSGLPELQPNAVCGISIATPQVIYCVGSYSGPARILKSADGGSTWSSTDLAPLATTLVDVYFRGATEGFAVGSIGVFYAGSRSVVLHTTDGGTTWQQLYVGSRLGEWGWKISFPTPTVGFVSLERFQGPMFILKTQDGGSTWSELPFEDYNEQGIGFATPEVGWIGGADNPTFGTTDGGATWEQTRWGDYINRFQFLSPTLGYATGVSVYRYAETSVATPDASPRQHRALAAPNPFGSRTTIRFSLPSPERVQIFIADPSGRVVRRLENGRREAGSHVVEWDGKDDSGASTPPGIYLYVLHAGTQHQMGKVARVR
jgi:photosystem II stability/assembly factor-like uncharacterized protein